MENEIKQYLLTRSELEQVIYTALDQAGFDWDQGGRLDYDVLWSRVDRLIEFNQTGT